MRKTHKQIIATSFFALAVAAAPLAAQAAATGQYIDDATITAKVKTALLADKQVSASQIAVETNEGAVKLNGTVATKTQEIQAVRDARQVNGVVAVNDLLQVTGNSASSQN